MFKVGDKVRVKKSARRTYCLKHQANMRSGNIPLYKDGLRLSADGSIATVTASTYGMNVAILFPNDEKKTSIYYSPDDLELVE